MNTITEHAVTVTQTDVAKMAKRILKQHYPGLKFSVRTSKYSMGSSINVSWTDGPRTQAVKQLVGHLHGAGFDGMTDSKYYLDEDTRMTPDGQVRHVSYANDYIFCQRDISHHGEKIKEATAYLLAHCECEQVGTDYRFGNDWVSNLSMRLIHDVDYTRGETLDHAFRRVILREEA